jgi:RHS repeat-associated protein
LTDSTQTIVWTALYQPFGGTPSVTGTLTTQSLRLPGQQFDAETGLNHNGFRDYAPGLTRYIESDPTGLGEGTNTYQYSRGNPLKYTDRRGLQESEEDLETTPVQQLKEALPQLEVPFVENTGAQDLMENVSELLDSLQENAEADESIQSLINKLAIPSGPTCTQQNPSGIQSPNNETLTSPQ